MPILYLRFTNFPTTNFNLFKYVKSLFSVYFFCFFRVWPNTTQTQSDYVVEKVQSGEEKEKY